MTKRTIKVIDLRSNCSFVQKADGWTATFPLFDLEASGETEDDAYAQLSDILGRFLNDADEAQIEKWRNFTANNIIEREMTAEEIRAEEELLEASHAAYAALQTVDGQSLEDFIATDTPALVDFWAEWCKPCHMMAPLLKQVADELRDRLNVGALDVDANEGIREKFGIMGIPTMILFRGGQELTRLVGTRPAGQLRSELEAFLT